MKKMKNKLFIIYLLCILFFLTSCDLLYNHYTHDIYKGCIYLIDTDGSNLTKVIDIGYKCDKYSLLGAKNIQYTPDGNKLIIDFNGSLFSVNIDGSDSTLINNTLPVWGQPSISVVEPKTAFSTKIEYSGGWQDSFYDIFIVNLDATGLTNLTNTYEVDEMYPCFTPNGYEIIFSTVIYLWPRNYYINRLNINSGTIDTLATNNDHVYRHLTFSPDGTKIYFTKYINNIKSLYVMTSDGTNQEQLYEDIIILDYLSFSPDGSKIVYNDYQNLYVMNSDGSGITQIETAINPRYSHISHNGAKIVYSDNSITGNIYIIDVDGCNEIMIHQGYKPTFSPDDSQIAFSGSYLYETIDYWE